MSMIMLTARIVTIVVTNDDYNTKVIESVLQRERQLYYMNKKN